jgi:hypothetical protein
MQATDGWDPGEFMKANRVMTCLHADHTCSHWTRHTQLRKIEGLGLGLALN